MPHPSHETSNTSTPDTSQTVRFAAAISDATHLTTATDQVIDQLKQQLAGPADLLTVFVAGEHCDALSAIYHKLNQAFAPAAVIGVTAGGIIGPGRELEGETGISVLAARLPGAHIQPINYNADQWKSILASDQTLGKTIESRDQKLKAIIMLADPFSTPMLNLLPTMTRCWPGVPVVGGVASAGKKAGQNHLLVNGRVLQTGAVGVAISGDIDVTPTISQGCRPIGQSFVITKSQRHIIYELGGRNALVAIQDLAEQLDEYDRDLIQTRGLMIGRVINEYKDRFGRGDFLIRQLLAIDQDSGYIAVNDPQIRVGQTVQFHVHDQKTAIQDFKLLLDAQELHGPGAGALLFSCNGRGSNLFDEPNTDSKLVSQALGDIPLAGFFAAGEIGPVGGENFLHGHTASLIVFRDAHSQAKV